MIMNRAFIRNFTTILFAILLLAACASQTETSEISKASDPTKTASKSKSDLICKREHQTGSHFKRKVCRTREEIEFLERETRDMMDSLPPGQATGGPPG
jgi:uncharacterized lipoprotein YajG